MAQTQRHNYKGTSIFQLSDTIFQYQYGNTTRQFPSLAAAKKWIDEHTYVPDPQTGLPGYTPPPIEPGYTPPKPEPTEAELIYNWTTSKKMPHIGSIKYKNIITQKDINWLYHNQPNRPNSYYVNYLDALVLTRTREYTEQELDKMWTGEKPFYDPYAGDYRGQVPIPTEPGEPGKRPRDPVLEELLSEEEKRIQRLYTNYLNSVDDFNASLLYNITDFFKSSSKYFEYTPTDLNIEIEQEYEIQKVGKLSYLNWKMESYNGQITLSPRITETSKYYAQQTEIESRAQRFLTGMGIGWEVANDLYIPQLATLNILRASPLYKNSEQMARALLRSAERAGSSLIKEEVIDMFRSQTTNLSNIFESTIQKQTKFDYKSDFLRLNAWAKRMNIIKNDWVLRLGKEIPIHEKYRRLYSTLASYIKRKQNQ